MQIVNNVVGLIVMAGDSATTYGRHAIDVPEQTVVLAGEQDPKKDPVRVLQEIARIANLLSAGSCCDDHEAANWKELTARLRLFSDDSFSSLK